MPLLPSLRLHCRLRDVASDSRRSGRDHPSTWRITRSTKQRSYISTLLSSWTNIFGVLVEYTVSTPSQPDFWQIGALSTECRPASLCSGPCPCRRQEVPTTQPCLSSWRGEHIGGSYPAWCKYFYFQHRTRFGQEQLQTPARQCRSQVAAQSFYVWTPRTC